MIRALLQFAVKARYAVLAIVVLICGLGLMLLPQLPVDAVPDITNKQVQINTSRLGLSPLEVEKQITYPIETALSGTPGLETTRSMSRSGFSQVTVVFSDATDLYFARQQITERLSSLKSSLPSGAEPQLGPVSTGLGEIYIYALRIKGADPAHPPSLQQLIRLRTLQDYVLKPQLKQVKGLASVDSIGGYEQQYVVTPDIAKLTALGLGLSSLTEALKAQNLSAGGPALEQANETALIRADARFRSLYDLENTPVPIEGHPGLKLKDLAQIRQDGEIRTGAATLNGQEVVIGTALMRVGENGLFVAKAVKARLETLKQSLPADVEVVAVLDRSDLVLATLETVQKNLIEGAVLVALVLFVVLGHWRAALIAVLVIPASFLLMAMGMIGLKIPGNLMSLGALDFGLIVDGSVIMIEHHLFRLYQDEQRLGRALNLKERLSLTRASFLDMVRPSLTGQVIILLVFVPLFLFTGVEGKTFAPMAATLVLALIGAYGLSITLVPALCAVLISKSNHKPAPALVSQAENWVLRQVRHLITRPRLALIAWGLSLGIAAGGFVMLGQEFIPQLDEKNLALTATRPASMALDPGLRLQDQIEARVAAHPDVRLIVSKTGTAEVATDPMPVNVSDGYVILKPQKDRQHKTKAEVIASLEDQLSVFLGTRFEVSQPIQMRFNEMIAGVRGDLAVKIYGQDYEQMGRYAHQVATILQRIPGAADVKVEQIEGSDSLELRLRSDALDRFGLSAQDVITPLSETLSGAEAGVIYDGDRPIPIRVRLSEDLRKHPAGLLALPISLPQKGITVPLSELVQFENTKGLGQISRENGQRRIMVQANVRGADLGAFFRQAQQDVSRLTPPTGINSAFDGQFQNLKAASDRLMLIVPVGLVLITGILWFSMGSLRFALLTLTPIPIGLMGGILALHLGQIAFSVSAAVGLMCLSGVNILNGLVLLGAIKERLQEGDALIDALLLATRDKLRPLIMAGLVPAIGFLPMILASGTGAEVQKPLALAVIGGLCLSSLLIPLILPALTGLVLRTQPLKS